MKSKIFVAYLISFILAVFFAPYISFKKEIFYYLGLFFFSISPLFYKVKVLKYFSIITAIFFLGVFHYKTKLPLNEPTYTPFYNGNEVAIYGYVVSEPTGEKVSNFYLNPVILYSDNEKIQNPKGNIAVTVREKDISFGEFIYIEGILQEPQDDKNYLQRFGTFSKISFPKYERAEGSYDSSAESFWIDIRKKLIYFKKTFILAIENIYPEPDSSLILGLLLGIKKTMPDWLKEAFNKTGTTHIIALSGFNITIIIMILKNLTKGLSRKLSFFIPIIFVILFVIMTGGEASVVRASVMGMTLLLAKRLGRQDDPKNSIVFTGFIMVYLNPFILSGDIGFLLSFSSMIGMIYLSPIFIRIFRFLPEIIKENLAVTLSAQAMAAPIILYYFSEFSIISPITNILILPAVPLAMLFSFIASISFFINQPLGSIIGWIGYLFSRYIIKTAEFFSNLSFASFAVEAKNPYFFIAYYIILIDIILYFNYLKRKNAEETV